MAEGTVFVSYRRSDAAGFAFSLHERLLEVYGAERLFMDVDSIQTGHDFDSRIRENVNRCHVLLAVIGRDWLQRGADGARRIDQADDWVRFEVSTALGRKIPVIPVLVGGASLPRADELPEPLKPLARRQSLDVRNASFQADADRLVDAIDRSIDGGTDFLPPRWTWRALAAFALVTCFILMASWVSLWNAAGVDDALDGFLLSRFERFRPPLTSPSLFVVTASDRTGGNGSIVERPGPAWRRYHAALIDALSAAGARVIAFDVLFDIASSGSDELARAIADAARRGTTVVLASEKVEFREGRAVPAIAAPFAQAPWGLVLGSPKRSLMPLAQRGPRSWSSVRPEPVVPSFALAAVAQFRRASEGASAVFPSLGPRGDTVQLRTEAGLIVEQIPVLDKYMSIAVSDRGASITPYPFHQIYETGSDVATLATFKDALVVVGIEKRSDLHETRGDAGKRYGVMDQALAINQLLLRRFIRRPNLPVQAALTVLMGAFGMFLRREAHPWLRYRFKLKMKHRGEKPLTISVALVACTLAYLFATLLVFRSWGIFLRPGYDLVALWGSYLAYGIARGRGNPFRVRARAVAALVTTGASLLGPTIARADPPMAQVVKIVVNGSVKNEALPAEARVIRARAGGVVPAVAAQLLGAGDELDTGPGVSVEIQYLADAVESDKTIIVGPASRVSIEDPTSLRVILGRILSNVRGFFQVPSGDTVLAVRGTEFEVRVADDGSTHLLVLHGVVAANAAKPAGPVLGLSVVSGATKSFDKIIMVRNGCEKPHAFAFEAPAVGWLKVARGPVRIGAGEKSPQTLQLDVDARGLEPGTRTGDISVKCLDCGDEPGCEQRTSSVPFLLEVTGPEGVVAPSEIVVKRLEEVTLFPGRRSDAKAAPTTEAAVRAVLHWTSEPIAAGRPNYGVPRTLPAGPKPSNPAQVLEETRFRAVVNEEPEAFVSLGRSYIAWGEGAKAVDALGRAAATDTDLGRSPAVLTDAGNAYRLKGDLDNAEASIRRAMAADPAFAPAHNALGNVYLDRAEIANQGQDLATEGRDLDTAERAFDAFLERSPNDPLARPVGLTSRGQVFVRKGERALLANDTDDARHRFEKARDSFEAAAESRPDYSYSNSGVGDAARGLARTAGRRGDRGLERRHYAEAQSAYRDALGRDSRLTPALTGLGSVFDETRRQPEALAAFRQGVATRPRDPIAQYQLGRMEAQMGDPSAVGRMEAYLALEKPRLRDGTRAREARKVVETGSREPPSPPPPTPIPTAQPTPRPTPWPTPSPRPPTNVRVPDVEGMNVRQALARLQMSGLRGALVEVRSCDRVGQVLGTDPRDGRSVAQGSLVQVRVGSAGPSPAVVPSLRNMPLRQAQSLLRAQRLDARVRGTRRTGQAHPGTVLDQRPAPQTRLAGGCPVELIVEEQPPPEPATVPNFVGMTEQQATSQLRKGFRGAVGAVLSGGLTLGTVHGGGVAYGRVVRQHPAPGSKVKPGTPVDLWIEGREPIGG